MLSLLNRDQQRRRHGGGRTQAGGSRGRETPAVPGAARGGRSGCCSDGNDGRQKRASQPVGRGEIHQRAEHHCIAVAACGGNAECHSVGAAAMVGWQRVALLVASTIFFSMFRSQASTGSPLQAFRLVTKAMNQGDGNLWSTLVHTANGEEEQARSVLASKVVAQAELRRALKQRFGQADYEASGFPRLLDDTPENQISTAVEHVTGDRGTVRLQRGSNLKFVLVEGIWKFDIFRSAPIPPVPFRMAVERGLAAVHEVGRRVSQGNYKDVRAALTDFQRQR